MILIAFFTDSNVPKTGLSPTIDVWEDDGTQVVTAGAMTEVAGGFYKYDFTGYDGSKNYSYRADGGASLADAERYVAATNELAGVWDERLDEHVEIGSVGEAIDTIVFDVGRLRDVEEGNWSIVGTQMIFFSRAGAEILRFNLFDENNAASNTAVFKRVKV